MADAGKIMIMPKGAYDASASYEVLDLVTHSDKAWVAKRNVTGVEPTEENSEDWFLIVDSSKLGGKDASEYALNADLANYLPLSGGKITGLLSIFNNDGAQNAFTHYRALMDGAETFLGKIGMLAMDAPGWVKSDGYTYYQFLHTGNVGEYAQKALTKLTIPAGANIEVSFSGSTVALINFVGWQTGLYATYLYHGYANGSARQKIANLNTSGSIPYEFSESAQKVTFRNATGATAEVSIDVMYGNPCTTTVVENPTSYPTTTPSYSINATLSTKPSGSYTGNGSATYREILTGGIGSACIIYSSESNTVILATPVGSYHSTNAENDVKYIPNIAFKPSYGAIGISHATYGNVSGAEYKYIVI